VRCCRKKESVSERKGQEKDERPTKLRLLDARLRRSLTDIHKSVTQDLDDVRGLEDAQAAGEVVAMPASQSVKNGTCTAAAICPAAATTRLIAAATVGCAVSRSAVDAGLYGASKEGKSRVEELEL
jgi:hypothetical protein